MMSKKTGSGKRYVEPAWRECLRISQIPHGSGACCMCHDYFFEPVESGTLMRDVFDYNSPLGFLGNVADAVFLERYMRGVL
jgi:hypothetical protein